MVDHDSMLIYEGSTRNVKNMGIPVNQSVIAHKCGNRIGFI